MKYIFYSSSELVEVKGLNFSFVVLVVLVFVHNKYSLVNERMVRMDLSVLVGIAWSCLVLPLVLPSLALVLP
jgi:hypothetical protein